MCLITTAARAEHIAHILKINHYFDLKKLGNMTQSTLLHIRQLKKNKSSIFLLDFFIGSVCWTIQPDKAFAVQ